MSVVSNEQFEAVVDRLATRDELRGEVDRLDHRMEVLVGASEDRMTGKIAETEARIMRRMDRRFDEMATVMHQSYLQLDAKIDTKVDGLRDEVLAAIARLEARIA